MKGRDLNPRQMTMNLAELHLAGISPYQIMNETVALRSYCERKGNNRWKAIVKLFYKRYRGLIQSEKRRDTLNARRKHD